MYGLQMIHNDGTTSTHDVHHVGRPTDVAEKLDPLSKRRIRDLPCFKVEQDASRWAVV